jgi:hypothetical protein
MEGGSVVNIAIELNGQPPLQAYVKPCRDLHIVLRSIDLGAVEVIETFEQLAAYNKVGSPFSIPKAALTLAGFQPGFSQEAYPSLRAQLEAFGSGIELTLLSAIPAGSGLGTSSILASTVAYYCYVMLGIYFDSFAPNGGDPYYQMAQQVAQAVDVSKYSGWDSKGGRSRYWFMENHTNSAYAPLREAYYNYHRLGLDMMTRDQPAARQAILQALKALQQVHRRNTSMLSLQQFVDVKIQEIISIFTPAPPEEQKVVYNIIRDISPINVSKLKGFNTK